MSGTGVFFLFIFLILVLGATSILLLVFYNILVKREEEANEAWAQVETMYQRKLDLVPSLLEAVETAADHEKGTLEGVTGMRAKAQTALEEAKWKDGTIEKVEDIIGALDHQVGKVRALAEKYPDLKVNSNFLSIQAQLEDTENKVAEARRNYNSWVKHYNASLKLFPYNLLAGVFRFHSKTYFKIEPVS